MAEKNFDMKKGESTSGWIERFFNHLKRILDEYLNQFPQYNEVVSFMERGELYDANGKPSERYSKLLNKINNCCVTHPLKVKHENNDEGIIRDEILKYSTTFLKEQRKLMSSYMTVEDKECWIESVLGDDKSKQSIFDEIINEETNTAIVTIGSSVNTRGKEDNDE